ncbi:hypothetical protein [Arthrobacter sp. Br18]|uniref:hypothetical protein n=1 Tax=Arthrobacter sp. Br18 TaxID=1312954 RepID=UPI000479762E|nr:hypothetical protein [Arthrobacter sp. Br18]
MSDLFSHPAQEPPPDRLIDDIGAEVTVPGDATHAWAGFIDHIHLWWPTALLSVWGTGSFFDLESNALVETSAEDDETVWAEVTVRVPPARLELLWRHRPGAASSTTVTVEFSQVELSGEPGTVVFVQHGGWEAPAGAGDLRSRYDSFWPEALSHYARFMGGSL